MYKVAKLFKEDHPQPVECAVTGTFPAWVKGSLYRNGSGLYQIGEDTFKHMFDGHAVLHHYKIEDGHVMYQNKIVESNVYKKNKQANRIVVSTFGTVAFPDPCKSIFKRYFSYFFVNDEYDDPGVNVLMMDDELYAMTETNIISKINPDDLNLIDQINFSKLISLHGATAHPHQEPDGTVYNIGTFYEKPAKYGIVKIPPPVKGEKDHLKQISLLSHIDARWTWTPNYNHSFCITENYIIIVEQPLAFSMWKVMTLKLLMRSFADCFEYYEDEPTNFLIIDKSTGEKLPLKASTGSFCMFHTINAYEDNGHLVLDMCTYNSGNVMQKTYLKALEEDEKNPDKSMVSTVTARRFVLPLSIPEDAEVGSNTVTLDYTSATAELKDDGSLYCVSDCLSDLQGIELPKINYENYNGKKYKYFYGVAFESKFCELAKVNVMTKETKMWKADGYDDYIAGEPIFIGAPEAKAEDEGVILSPIISTESERNSFLVALDASTFTEIARAVIPAEIVVPMSFHGIFVKR